MLIREDKRPPNSVSTYFSGKLLLSAAEMKQKSESAVELPWVQGRQAQHLLLNYVTIQVIIKLTVIVYTCSVVRFSKE